MIKKLKKGFTLVELIVVMAIIAILSTVAVVSYSAIVKKAEQSKVDSELAQIVNVLRAEAVETVKVETEGSTEELTLSLSEKGELKFVVNFSDDVKLNELFDDLLAKIELGEYDEDGNLDLDIDLETSEEYQRLVYTVGTVSSTHDVVIEEPAEPAEPAV